MKAVITTVVLVYFASVIIEIPVRIARTIKPEWNPASRNTKLDLIARSNPNRRKLGTVLVGALYVPSAALAWPFGFRAEARIRRRASDIHYMSALQLRPEGLLISLYNLGIAVIAGVLTVHNDKVWRTALLAVVILVLAAASLRHLFYIGVPLADRLRRSLINPFFMFAAIAVAEAIELCILIAIVKTDVGRDSTFTAGAIRDAGEALFNVPNNIMELFSMNALQIVVALVGALYSLALLRWLVRPNEFRRTDNDIRAIASQLVTIGDIKGAQNWLDKEKEESADAVALRGRISLSKGRIDEAIRHTRRALRMRSADTSLDSVAGAIASILLITEMSDQSLIALCRYFIRNKCSECAVLSLFHIAFGKLEDRKEFSRELMNDALQMNRPLVRAALLEVSGDLRQAVSVVKSAVLTRRQDKLQRLLTLCNFIIIDPDLDVVTTANDILAWRTTSMPSVVTLSSSLSGTERLNNLGGLLGTAELVAMFSDDLDDRQGDIRDELRDLSGALTDAARELADSPDQFRIAQNITRLTIFQ